jgi:hypothetical protein
LVASSKALVLLDTNICIAREDPLLVKRNVRQLFEHLARLRVNYVVHPKTFDESSRGQKHEQKYFFISKLGCYPLLRSPPDPNNDDEFLNTVGRSSEKSDRVDNALLYAVYKGAVTCLITEDKAIRANAKKLRIKEKVISVDGALKILDQKSQFDNISFTWSEAFVDHTRDKVLGATVELVGRADEVNQLRSLIEDQNVRAIVISGLPGVGKTRITLKATEYRQDDVLAIAPPHPTSAEDLKRRIPQALDKEMLVIIDNADSKTAEALLDELPRCTGMKLLITTDVADFICPNHGDACRTRTVVIFPLADQYSEELLRMAGARLGYNLESYWIPKIGGIPGVLLEAAVAQAQSRLKKEAAAVVRDKERACIKWARRTLGDDAVKRIQLLSVLERVGVEKAAFDEIKAICEIFSSDMSAFSVVEGLGLLESAGVVQSKGWYVEVLSPLLANGLTRELMLRHSYDFITLFKRLNLDGQERLLKRLQPVKVKQAELFWSFFFSEGPFADFQTALANSNLLYPAARANPNRVSQLIESGLRNTTISDRRAIFIAHRRGLAHALSALLLNHRTYEIAANNLALLAEADTDSENSNATRYFCSYFYPHHPQVQSKFKTRTKQLEEALFNQNKPIQLRKLGVTAISSSLEPMAVPLLLQPSDAAEPLKPPATGIMAEMLEYMEGLIGLLMRAASEEPALAKSALAALPKANVDYLVLLLRFPSPENRITKVIDRFKILVDWVIAHKPLSVAGLDETLERCDYLLKKSVTERGNVTAADLEKLSSFSGESQDELNAAVSEIKESRDILVQYADVVEGLIQKLDGADFTIRLKKWVGRDWPLEEHEEPYTLAKEAITSPEILTDALMTWLCTAEARRSDTFLFALGALDGQLQFVSIVVYSGAGTRGMENLASYLRGLYGIRPDFVTAKLDEFAENEQVHGDVIVKATGYTGFSIDGYERILKLLREGKASPSHVMQAISSSSWIEGLNYDECARIVELAAAANLENATLIIDYLHAWSQRGRTLVRRLTELAWSCLEAMSLMRDRDAWSFDGLASKLAKPDHERGLRLLGVILTRHLQVSHEEWSGLVFRWDPLPLTGPHKFWETLWEHDREGTLRFVLQIASDYPESMIQIELGLRNVIDQDTDLLTLATIARENETQAELVARFITPRKPNFSQIAYGILECYPDNIRIHEALINGCVEEEAAVGQELLERLTRKLEKIESAEADTEVPKAVKPWLKKVGRRLKYEQELVKNRLLDRPGAIIFRSSAQN